jgi:hypothetical protein
MVSGLIMKGLEIDSPKCLVNRLLLAFLAPWLNRERRGVGRHPLRREVILVVPLVLV